jgi:plastocyanin
MTNATLRRVSLRLAVTAVMFSSIARAHCEESTVTIDNFTFAPAELTVKVGTTVTWKNHDDIPHTIVSAGKFRSKALDTDDSYSFTFTTAGAYAYFCSLHPHMTGTIKVE